MAYYRCPRMSVTYSNEIYIKMECLIWDAVCTFYCLCLRMMITFSYEIYADITAVMGQSLYILLPLS